MLRALSERPLRLPRLRPYAARPGDPRIFTFNTERDDIVEATVARVCAKSAEERDTLEQALADAAYHEARRLEAQSDDETRASLGYWRSLLRRIARMSDRELEEELTTVTTKMARDVAGNFDTRVYDLARKVGPRLVQGLMSPTELPAALTVPAHEALDTVLGVEGAVDHLRAIEPKGTLVYVPTHSSNLDSIVLGQALERVGLSPVMYGAGKNLFTNPIISFFMHNLGAYRVDRRIRTALYKEVLKTYAAETVRRGYHNLFFPGGTRSRSNLVESHLKLGLMGAAVEAAAERHVQGDRRPVYFVPTTINYALVLEGETLADDWLKDEGKSRYIIEDDEFSRLDRWFAFFRKMVHVRGACVIRFGDPIDPYGNPVDFEGRSVGPGGRIVDPRGYVLSHGEPVVDLGRDAAYTRDLGDHLVSVYRKQTVVMATNLVAHVLFRRLVAESPGLDLFALMRLRGELVVPREELDREVGRTRDRLRALSARGEVRLATDVASDDPGALVDRTISIFTGYHRRMAVTSLDGRVTLEDPTLVLYYQNRLASFAEAIAPDEERQAARFIAKLGARR